MKKRMCVTGVISTMMLSLFVSCNSFQKAPELKSDFVANWDSLAQHQQAPQWLQDAKLGIYFHWGVYTVPAFGSEWYPRLMYFEGDGNNCFHKKNFGSPAEFGYHKFIPMFKAEKFNADEWVDLFVKAGAKFAGPVAEHHDGFSMWNSKVNPWNAKAMGPHRDIVGELKQALDKRDMKMITTFHHARNLQRYANKPDEKEFGNSHYPYLKGTDTASEDSLLRILYGNVPESTWAEKYWFGKLKEVIDGYSPDAIWFDSWLFCVPEEWRQKFCAYYINESAKKGKEVAIISKNALPKTVAVENLEKSRKQDIQPITWFTDETISTGSWSYVDHMQIKEAGEILNVLLDIVSKNGILLLNISPDKNGMIPEEQRRVLLSMGDWLYKYGEAVYATRPWYIYGEGPTKEPEGTFDNAHLFLKLRYTTDDIRYTTKGDNIYALVLGVPDAGKTYMLKAFAADNLPKPVKIKQVSLMGYGGELNWSQSVDGLSFSIPDDAERVDDKVYAFKIEIE